MIDTPPKPLPQHRLGRLMHGLRQRMTGSLQETAAEVSKLEDEIKIAQRTLNQKTEQLKEQLEANESSTTTRWDEAVHDCWDAAELKTYKAIFETADLEKRARKEAKAKIENATQEAKQKIQEFEQRFMRAKEKPLTRLRKFRAANRALADQLDAIDNRAQNALTNNNLRIPESAIEDSSKALNMSANETEADASSAISTSMQAYEELKLKVNSAEEQCNRFLNSPLLKFFDSFAFWAVCALVLIGTTAGLFALGVLELMPSILAGAGTTIGLIVLTLLAIRPWLKRSAAQEFPKLKFALAEARELFQRGERLALKENETELARLAQKRDERAAEAKNWRDNQVIGFNQQFEQAREQLRKRSIEDKVAARDGLTESLSNTDNKYRSRLDTLDSQHKSKVEDLSSQFAEQSSELRSRIEEIDLGGATRMRVASQKAASLISRSRRFSAEHFPEWSAFEADALATEPAAGGSNTNATPARFWPAGLLEPRLPLGELLVEQALPDNSELPISSEQMQAPVLFSPLQDEYLVIHGDPANPQIRGLVRNLLLRALTTLPAGRTQVCIIDPPGLGRDFGWLMHLSDFDADLVTHRVWTQTSHIINQLSTLALAAEDFIQQSLRSDYADIVQYNLEAGALAEPFRILVWNSMPNGMDDQSWKSLQSILDSGARCGIIPILIVDPKEPWPYGDQQALINRRGLHVELDESGKHFQLASKKYGELHFAPNIPPSEESAQKIVREVGRRSLLSNRVEVPLERMVPEKEERWQGDSSHSLEVPIGQSGVGRTHCLKLGIGTAQHAVIAGKTGSGKSSMLHALITSAALKYSPEALRLVLLDFKKGVEFQVYADAEIPHADIIGIESHREFGLSALEYIDGCMQRRGESFRKSGVQDIASWNALHPDEPIPRMLVVIDEFQELFVEDDKLSGQASLILDRIVRQGRSFGVHAVLSSQTLAGSYSLPRTTLGQMAVRIALQCDASDAQIIFAEDNPAAARLKHPGQAVYNDAGGRIEGNQPMQIGWLPKEKQVQWLSEQPQGYRNRDASTNLLGRTIVYDGNKSATWSTENVDMALRKAVNEVNPDASWCVAGESVAIEPAVVYPLTRQAGRNALIVGPEDELAASVLHVSASSFAKANPDAHIIAVQGAKPTDAKALSLTSSWKTLPCHLQVGDQRDADKLVSEVHSLLLTRMGDGASSSSGDVALSKFGVAEPNESVDDSQNKVSDSEQPDSVASPNESSSRSDKNGISSDQPILLCLIQIGRMRDLRKEDDFASFGDSELLPDKKLEEILRDGPSVGIHTLIWAESYSTVNRWLSRSALREIELRMLMQMSANDSTNLVDSVAASRLGEHVMLLFDEATGAEERFRPYSMESLKRLEDWAGIRS